MFIFALNYKLNNLATSIVGLQHTCTICVKLIIMWMLLIILMQFCVLKNIWINEWTYSHFLQLLEDAFYTWLLQNCHCMTEQLTIIIIWTYWNLFINVRCGQSLGQWIKYLQAKYNHLHVHVSNFQYFSIYL